MKWRKTISRRKGFTLLEIMVSLAILATALVALLSANNKALSMTAGAAELTDAVALAREEMEKFYIEPLPEPGVSMKKKRDDYPLFEWRSEIVETPFQNVWEVRLNVFKAGDENERSVFTLKSYVSRSAAP